MLRQVDLSLVQLFGTLHYCVMSIFPMLFKDSFIDWTMVSIANGRPYFNESRFLHRCQEWWQRKLSER